MLTTYTYMFIVLIKQTSIVTILAICVIFFLILLILGVRKSYKLKAENDKLMKASDALLKDEKEEYVDFTEGHMYQKKKEIDK